MYRHVIFGIHTENYLLFVRHSSLMEHGIFLLNISCNSIYRSKNGPWKLFYHLGFERVYQDANILNIVLISRHFLLFKQIFKCLLISVKAVVPTKVYIHPFLFTHSTPNHWPWKPTACLPDPSRSYSQWVPKIRGSSLALDYSSWLYFRTLFIQVTVWSQRSIRYGACLPREDKVH